MMSEQEIIGRAISATKWLTNCTATEAADRVFERLYASPSEPVAAVLSADLPASEGAAGENGRPE